MDDSNKSKDAGAASRPAAPVAGTAAGQSALKRANPESTVTLMVQAGQTPGSLFPAAAPSGEAPAPKGWWARLRAALGRKR